MSVSVNYSVIALRRAFRTVLAGTIVILCLPAGASEAELKSAREIRTKDPRNSNVSSHTLPPTLSDWNFIAGDYFFGDGFETNCSLQLPGNGRFSYTLDGCTGTYEHIEGTARIQRNKVILTPTSPAEKRSGRGFYTELLPVTWGDRMYLIPANDIIGFVNSINRGSEPVTHGSHGRYYLREGDWDREANGLPVLPKTWQNYILNEPVHTRILGKSKAGQWKVDAGTDAGLYPKMELFATAPDRQALATLHVTRVEGNVAYAIQIPSEKPLDLNTWTVSSQASLDPTAQPGRRNAEAEVPAPAMGIQLSQ